MIKLICDRCKADCKLNAYDIRVNVLHNPVPSHFRDLGEPHITDDKTRMRLILCQKCYSKLKFPNIYTVNRNNELSFDPTALKESE